MSSIARRLLRQHGQLRLNIQREFAAMEALRADHPRFHLSMAAYEKELISALQTNEQAITNIFGAPAQASAFERASEWAGFAHSDVYDGLGSLWRHLAKDWSSEGAKGSHLLRTRLVSLVVDECARWPDETVRVLVPGCGQARLAWALAAATPRALVTGLERSAPTISLARHILQSKEAGSLAFHPWLDAFPNNASAESRCARISVPDVHPTPQPNLVLESTDFMATGQHEGRPPNHLVLTHFFLDCVDDIPACMQRIHDELVPGGVWIFAGPLHYFQGGGYEPRPAPALDHLLHLAADLGLEVEMQPQLMPAPYVRRPGAFLHEADWQVPLFTARRVPP